jgi:hypothetical protein
MSEENPFLLFLLTGDVDNEQYVAQTPPRSSEEPDRRDMTGTPSHEQAILQANRVRSHQVV